MANLVASYNDLAELMVLAAQGEVVLQTNQIQAEGLSEGHRRPSSRQGARKSNPRTLSSHITPACLKVPPSPTLPLPGHTTASDHDMTLHSGSYERSFVDVTISII